jgi:hypothetical protein
VADRSADRDRVALGCAAILDYQDPVVDSAQGGDGAVSEGGEPDAGPGDARGGDSAPGSDGGGDGATRLGVDQACAHDDECATLNCAGAFCTRVSGPPYWVTLDAGLSVARYALGAATDSEGRVYALGGTTGFTSGQVDQYDPTTGHWSILPSG